MCREQAALWLTSRPQKLSNPLAQTVLFRRSSTADRPRATSINFFLPSATFVRQVGSRRDCLSCDVSVKHLQCRVWKANSLSFLWLQSRTTCRVYLRSSGCFLVLSSTTKQQQQRNSQIHCNVLKKLPPHIWISPGEKITSLQDAAGKKDVNKRQPAIKFNKHHLYTPERAPLTSLLVIFLPVTDVLLTQLVSVWQNLPHYSHQHMMIWQFLTDAPAVRARMIPNPFEPRRLMWLSKQENPDQQSQCLSWRLRPQTATCLLDSRWNLWSNNPLQCFQLGLSTNKCWKCAFCQTTDLHFFAILRYVSNDYALIRFRRKNYVIRVWKGDVLA